MDWLQAVILAIVQGITEFLPISSSAHLILVPYLVNWPDQGLGFDIAVHLGTLTAVLVYFRKIIKDMLIGSTKLMLSRQFDEGGKLTLKIIVATIPAVIAGLLLNEWIENQLRSMVVIASTSIGFGLLLWLADHKQRHHQRYHQHQSNQQLALADISYQAVLFIGMMQALALIPGTSRSGITMTAALLIGINRQTSATFSMLLAIPLILASSALLALKLISTPMMQSLNLILVGFLISALTAWLVIHLLIQFVERIGMLPFVIYRVLLGVILLVFFL